MTGKKDTQGKKLLRVKAMGAVGNAPAIGDASTANVPWVKFGAHNLFPEFCRGLADNCSPLNACVETFGQYIAGDGIELLDENDEPMKDAHNVWSELCGEAGEEALLEATALDLALMNTMSWEVLNSRIGPALINHIDVCRIRAKQRVDGVVPAYFFSSNWAKRVDTRYKPVEIPAWGTAGEAKTLMYRRSYKQLRDYYGEPHWIAAMVDAEVLARIPVFNRTQLDGGFKPAVHAHLTTTKDDADLDELDESFELAFTGDNGKPYVLTVGATNETLSITKLERGDHAGELDATRRVSKEEIYHSYGIPPVLMGVNVNTGLSGKGLAIQEELSLFQTTKVRPKQRHIEACIKMILRERGIDVPNVRIRPLVPFEPAADAALVRMTYLRSTTVGEDRIARKMPLLSTDGKDTERGAANYDERNDKMLVEVTGGAQAETNNANANG
jgi:hypothetical protein